MYVDETTGTIVPTCVRNSFNYKLYRSLPRPLTKPSRTIPDQVLSIDEILRRYARDPSSVPPAHPVYDSPYPDTSRMDRLDKLQTAMDLRENIEAYQQAVEAHQTAEKKKAERLKQDAETDNKTPEPVPAVAPTPPSTKADG